MHKRRVDDAQLLRSFQFEEGVPLTLRTGASSLAGALSHQMVLALARLVTTLARIVTPKVELRPEGRVASQSGGASSSWDFLFH